jgi:ATP-binding cassette, subfamily G (WHITE), member 2
VQAVINAFPVEKAVIIKEQASSSYKLSAYFLSKFLSELPLNLLGPALFGTIVYWVRFVCVSVRVCRCV